MSETLSNVEGAITFLDVLGWKGIWNSKNDAIEVLIGLVRFAEDERKAVLEEGTKKFPELRGKDPTYLTIFSISDTIVIANEGEPHVSLWLHGELCKKLICRSVRESIPLRGATCYGSFSIAFSPGPILLGRAVDEAASWHESTNWIGVIQTPSASILFEEYIHEAAEPWKMSDKIPLKDRSIPNLIYLDWSMEWVRSSADPKKAYDEIRRIFGKAAPLLPEISKYYLNTLAIFRELKNDQLRWRSVVQQGHLLQLFKRKQEFYLWSEGNKAWLVNSFSPYSGLQLVCKKTWDIIEADWEVVSSWPENAIQQLI